MERDDLTESTVPADEAARPVSEADRIVALDFIRGIAVIGILFPNIVAFGHPMLAYYWPHGLPGGASMADEWIWLVQFVLVDGKFRGLFTLLFGAGIVLFLDRIDAKGGDASLQFRRLAWLGAFGLIHTFLIWPGDILLLYAPAGFVALAMAYWPAVRQLRVGVAWFIAGSLAFSALLFAPAAEQGLPDFINPTPVTFVQAQADAASSIAEAEEEIDVTRDGSWLNLVVWRIGHHGPELPVTIVAFSLMETIPLMLVGMALYRMGLFEGRPDHAKMKRWGWAGLAAGAILSVPLGLWVMRSGFPLALTEFVFNGPSALLHLPMVMGLAALLSLWTPFATKSWLGRRIVAVGRMAFSNYIGTSLLMMLVFQGWAGGMFDQFHRIGLLPFVLVTWALMLAWSAPWLERFRYGPLEWLWRCLTYGKMITIRKKTLATATHSQ